MGCSVEKTITTETTVEETEGVGYIIEEADYQVFDNGVFSFEYDPEYFVVMEDGEYVIVSFYNEETQAAGSNTITFKEIENADAMEVAKDYAKQYGVDENSVYETNFGEQVLKPIHLLYFQQMKMLVKTRQEQWLAQS